MATQTSPSTVRLGRQPGPRNNPVRPRSNGSILSFFKKAEPPLGETADENLFLSDGEADDRYNESGGSVKRRRVSMDIDQKEDSAIILSGDDAPHRPVLQDLSVGTDQDDDKSAIKIEPSPCHTIEAEDLANRSHETADEQGLVRARPTLKREPTSAFEDNFDGIDDFVEDEFPADGEETMERRYMEEQRLMELEFDSGDEAGDEAGEIVRGNKTSSPSKRDGEPQVSECPICGRSLTGHDGDSATLHVNDCLDGKTIPVETAAVERSEIDGLNDQLDEDAKPQFKRFQRAAIAKPGQANPFSLDVKASGGSAFSKIMASHAEDSAWATAAANEVSARGQPAFKRTCPFYKILPGFFICVDAFRYGAVEGCHAYFLSHFHSDHYIGLTSSWCHGPIYCSHVTANLVRQQLRVDPKWVVDLDWDSGVEVPRTQGVRVTMIPANHCPGSSLFLFEKAIERGGSPRLQRVLHCGDFRACPAHVQHPLLRPDVVEKATGKTRQQKLDVCYLDTTYLTPKYAFPRQEEVILACADMCLSLSKEWVDESDSWEQVKKQRAGSGMAKFIRKGSDILAEPGSDGSDIGPASHRRGRLLVVVGTYSIGKERICLGVAKALNSKIFAPPGKQRICAALEDPELNERLTGDPLEAQVHMQMLMEIRAETLSDYLTGYKPHFSRIVGFRPSGWNYRPPNSRFVESPAVQTVLYSDNWKPSYSMAELVPQRGSTREASCFGVPYSEHSSFRELTMFCCALHIDKIIPTVNVGSAKSRERMKSWIERWNQDKKKNGLFVVSEDARAW